MKFSLDIAYARQLDQQDELASFRQRFVVSAPGLIYLDGNSLGRLPVAARERLETVINHEWGDRLIRSWNEAWFTLPEQVGGKIARLLGAESDEIIVADSTSVNLFKLALSAMYAQPDRYKIVTDNLNFPSDLYILQGVCKAANGRFHDGRSPYIQIVPSADGIHGPTDALAEAIDENTALVSLSHTAFKSGYTYDMAAINELAHRAGAITLWDLSHSAGSVPVDLNGANADLAVGCTYKYLNGGPGAPAFLYVRRDWQEKLNNPISGWMGQRNLFDFGLDYKPASGLRRFLTGTPPVLSLAAIESGVDLLLEAGMDRLREKSARQSDYLIQLWQELLDPLGFRLNSPRNLEQRGSHISLGHSAGWQINQALIQEMNVLPDFRKPDNIRLGIAPLYTTFEDVWTAVNRLHAIVVQKRYENYSLASSHIT